jgi:hypothetical protein
MQDADVRLVRRIRCDTIERGRDVNSVLEQVTLLLLKIYLYFEIVLLRKLGSTSLVLPCFSLYYSLYSIDQVSTTL